jgi:5-methylcytosine-specific restriction endonuclease McrA
MPTYKKTLILNKGYFPIRFATAYAAIGKFYCGNVEAIVVGEDGNYNSYSWDEWLKMSLPTEECWKQKLPVYKWPDDQRFIEATSQRIAVPSILRCLKYDRIPKTTLRLTRKAIYERDNFTCCYCGNEFGESKLTLDHVKPKSRGGQNSWENLVTACKSCNEKKGDKTPQEIQWKMRFAAFRPNISNIAKIKATVSDDMYCPEWKNFGV